MFMAQAEEHPGRQGDERKQQREKVTGKTDYYRIIVGVDPNK
jgi:hypothetical protein